MESQVIFRDGQDNDPADYNHLQDFARRSLDHVVLDVATAERRYAGLASAASSATAVTVQPGRLYSEGRVYVRAEALVKDFLTSLPIATRKNVLLVAYGEEIETDARPREYLLNEETGASEPRVAAMERARICTLSFASGNESADPVDPVFSAGVLPIARIVLSPVGVVSVTMIAENHLVGTGELAVRMDKAEAFDRSVGFVTQALAGDLASIKASLGGLVDKPTYARGLVRLATIEAKVGIPSNAADSSADFFLDKRATDETFPGYVARVAEGIRFPHDARAETQLQIFDALNAKAKIVGGLMLPAYTVTPRLAVDKRQGELSISSYTYQVHNMVQRTMSRTRIRYGDEQTVCSNSAWWQTGQYDAPAGVFQKDGEQFKVSLEAEFGDVPGHNLYRVQRFWYDSYEEPYWAQVTVNHAVPGSQVAETFLNANAGWQVTLALDFTRLAAEGGVTIAICETDRGAPDLSRVISVTTLERAQLKIGMTHYPISPVFLKGGTRYAFQVISGANHFLATTQGENFPQGTLFTVLDGAFQQGDGTRDLCFALGFASFTQARAVIELQPLNLAGGMTAIDILADSIVPASCDLTYEAQVNSAWVPLAPALFSALSQGGVAPQLVPLRAVFTGTPDVMPAVRLTGSRVRAQRPKTALKHVSTVRTLPGAGSASIRVVTRLEYFVPANHSASVKLLTGAGFATVNNPSSFVDVVAEDGSIERTWIFNLGAAVTSYRRQVEATTTSVFSTFHFGWVKDYAL